MITREEVEQLETADWAFRFRWWTAMTAARAESAMGVVGSQPPDCPAEFFRCLPTVLRLLGRNIHSFRRDTEAAANNGHLRHAEAHRSTVAAVESHLIKMLRDGTNDPDNPVLWIGAPALAPHVVGLNEHTAAPFHALPEPFRSLPTTLLVSGGYVLLGPSGAAFGTLSDMRERAERASERLRWDVEARVAAAREAELAEKREREASPEFRIADLQRQVDELRRAQQNATTTKWAGTTYERGQGMATTEVAKNWTTETLEALRLAYGGVGPLLDTAAAKVPGLEPDEFFAAWARVRKELGVADHPNPARELQLTAETRLRQIASVLVSEITHLAHVMCLRAAEILAAGHNHDLNPLIDADAYRDHIIGFMGGSALPCACCPPTPRSAITGYGIDGESCLLLGPGPAGSQFYTFTATKANTDHANEQLRQAENERRRKSEQDAARERELWMTTTAEGRAQRVAEEQGAKLLALAAEVERLRAGTLATA